MKQFQHAFANKLGKSLAKPLSMITCSRLLYTPFRLFDSYLNLLHGKGGAGTSWNLRNEVHSAAGMIHREKPVCFDIGANVGNWSRYMLEFKPQAVIYMFDPSPGCQAAIRAKNLPGITLIPCAVGERPGRAPFHFSSETDGGASLYVRDDTPFRERSYETIEVEITTVDTVVAEKQIDFIDFMKMDIEGHELFALRGAQKTLAAGKIGALSFEFGCTNVNSRTFFKDFWDLLTAAGFSLSRITPRGIPVKITSYYEDQEYFRSATNYIAELTRHPYASSRPG